MVCTEKFESDFMAMVELNKEIGLIVQRTIDEGHKDLSSSDLEYILKMVSDVTDKIKTRNPELTV